MKKAMNFKKALFALVSSTFIVSCTLTNDQLILLENRTELTKKINKNFDVNGTISDGTSLLKAALDNKDASLFRLLANSGANLDITVNENQTLLEYYVSSSFSEAPILDAFFENGINFDGLSQDLKQVAVCKHLNNPSNVNYMFSSHKIDLETTCKDRTVFETLVSNDNINTPWEYVLKQDISLNELLGLLASIKQNNRAKLVGLISDIDTFISKNIKENGIKLNNDELLTAIEYSMVKTLAVSDAKSMTRNFSNNQMTTALCQSINTKNAIGGSDTTSYLSLDMINMESNCEDGEHVIFTYPIESTLSKTIAGDYGAQLDKLRSLDGKSFSDHLLGNSPTINDLLVANQLGVDLHNLHFDTLFSLRDLKDSIREISNSQHNLRSLFYDLQNFKSYDQLSEHCGVSDFSLPDRYYINHIVNLGKETNNAWTIVSKGLTDCLIKFIEDNDKELFNEGFVSLYGNSNQPSIYGSRFFDKPRAYQTLAWLNLLSTDREQQDPAAARVLFAKSYLQLADQLEAYEEGINKWIAKHNSAIDRENARIAREKEEARSNAFWSSIGTIAAGMYLGSRTDNPNQILNTTRSIVANNYTQLDREITSLNVDEDGLNNLAEIMEADLANSLKEAREGRMQTLDDDGIRMYVGNVGERNKSIIGGKASRYKDGEHFYKNTPITPLSTTRLMPFGCTTTQIDPKTLGVEFKDKSLFAQSGLVFLTNQHCVYDSQKNTFIDTYLEHNYFGITTDRASSDDRFAFKSGRYFVPKTIITSKYPYEDGDRQYWENDWALLVVTPPPNWYDCPDSLDYQYVDVYYTCNLRLSSAKLASEETINRVKANPKANRLGRAGHSSHLEDGKFLTLNWGCRLDRYNNKTSILYHNCKGIGGDSGSAIFLSDGKNQFDIIGVHSFGSVTLTNGQNKEMAKVDPKLVTQTRGHGAVDINFMRKQLKNGNYRVINQF